MHQICITWDSCGRAITYLQQACAKQNIIIYNIHMPQPHCYSGASEAVCFLSRASATTVQHHTATARLESPPSVRFDFAYAVHAHLPRKHCNLDHDGAHLNSNEEKRRTSVCEMLANGNI